jgi:hypothetical protein
METMGRMITVIMLWIASITFGITTTIRMEAGEPVTSARVLLPFVACLGFALAATLAKPDTKS